MRRDGVLVRIKPNGNGQQPHLGEAPDCWVEVDSIPPTVRLLPPLIGSGSDVGTMTIQWLAHDKNLVSDSIALKYADRPDGPWLPIADHVENTSRFAWLMPPDAPRHCIVRVEATDLAGNAGFAQTAVDLAQPPASILAVEPVRQ